LATYDAGIVTAYGAAVRGGYTGTYEEFCAQQANYAQNAAAVEQAKEDVQELIESIPEDYSQLSDDVSSLKEDIQDIQEEIEGGGSGLTADLKAALDQLAQKVAYIDEDGQDYYDALHAALYPPANLTSISCLYTQSGAVYTTTSLDDLKSDLVVTAHYDNSTTQVVTNYALTGTLTVGTSVVTVAYGGKTTTFNVAVSPAPDLRTKLYDWDFTTGLVDSVQGTTAELSENVTRDSAGVHIPGGLNIVKLANVTLNQYTIELDVTSVTQTSVDECNLFCTAQANYAGSRCGLWYSTYWGYRLSTNANATNSIENNTDVTLFNGKTMKAKIDYTNKSIKVYADDVLVCDFNNAAIHNNRTYVGLGSTYNGSVGSVITACRIYEGVD